MKQSGFLIAATASGCGKTTFSLGLMRALARQGRKIQPFKCGPDYIDTQFHREAAGVPSLNLDTFMASETHVREVYARGAQGMSVCVAEGVMGMFDGYERMRGSSADIARLLGIPVILLVNAASTAYSVAATISGFSRFRPDVRVAGVVFNRVASANHFTFLREACEDAGVECLGYIRRQEGLQTPSRHLGLTLTGRGEMDSFISRAADAVEEGVDIQRLLELTVTDVPVPDEGDGGFPVPTRTAAVARDEAFSFIYPENLRSLRREGCRIVEFSPLRDNSLPEADILYLPGGYPELYAPQLAANTAMRGVVRDYIRRGGLALAECGGMIYLTRDIDGHPMCGIIPASCTMEGAKLTLGYRTVTLGSTELRGHEFHYSRLTDPAALPSVAVQRNVRGLEVATPLYRYKNLFAGYTHLYWAERGIMSLWNL